MRTQLLIASVLLLGAFMASIPAAQALPERCDEYDGAVYRVDSTSPCSGVTFCNRDQGLETGVEFVGENSGGECYNSRYVGVMCQNGDIGVVVNGDELICQEEPDTGIVEELLEANPQVVDCGSGGKQLVLYGNPVGGSGGCIDVDMPVAMCKPGGLVGFEGVAISGDCFTLGTCESGRRGIFRNGEELLCSPR